MMGLIVMAVHRVRKLDRLDSRQGNTIYQLLIVLIAWGMVSSALAITGIYSSTWFLSLMPGFWLPLIPFILVVGGVLIVPRLHSALVSVFNSTPQHWLILIHGLRILAIGTIIKVIRGEFPAYFALLVGVPDMLFGLSALILGFRARHRDLKHRRIILWNLMGMAIILPAAPLIQMGLPGPLQVFTSEPTAERLLDFPMVLAPSLIVPIFALLNMLVVWGLTGKHSNHRKTE